MPSIPSGTPGLLLKAWNWTYPRWKRWRQSRQVENQVQLALEGLDVRVEAFDAGHVTVRLLLANFSSAEIIAKHIELYAGRINTYPLSRQAGLLVAHGSAAPRRLGWVAFELELRPTDLRTIAYAITPSQHLRSAPDVRIELEGTATMTARGREVRVFFRLSRERYGLYLPPAVCAEHDRLRPAGA